MKIQTPFTVLPKYFNDFHNYSNNANEELVSYTYIPYYLRKNTERIQKILVKVIGIRNVQIILINGIN